MCVSNCSPLAWSCVRAQAKLPWDDSPELDVQLNPDSAQRWAVIGTDQSKSLQSVIVQRLNQQLPLILRGAVIRAEILGNASIPQPHHFTRWAQCCTHMQWSSVSHLFTSCWGGDAFPSHASAWLLSTGGPRQPPSAWPVVTWADSTSRLCSYQLPSLRLREMVVFCSGLIPWCCLSQKQPRQTENVWLGVLLLVHSNISQGGTVGSQNAKSPRDTKDPGEEKEKHPPSKVHCQGGSAGCCACWENIRCLQKPSW